MTSPFPQLVPGASLTDRTIDMRNSRDRTLSLTRVAGSRPPPPECFDVTYQDGV